MNTDKIRAGLDNYCLHPKNFTPRQMLEWAVKNSAEGVAFSGLTQKQYDDLKGSGLDEISGYAAEHDLYLEWGGGRHIPYDLTEWTEKCIFENNLQRAREALQLNTRIIRSCSGGLMRWQTDSLPTETLMQKTAEALQAQETMLRDHHVILAIETHFEFTSFELLRIFDMIGAEPGGCFGICLDTMNLLVMLEDPVAATKRLLPWVVSTHIKDGGIFQDEAGLHPFPCEIGKGIVDIEKILILLKSQPRRIDLSVEDHGGHFNLPVHNQQFMNKFPDLTADEMSALNCLTVFSDTEREKGSIDVVSRDIWPDICETRTKNDLKALKRFRDRLQQPAVTDSV